MCDSLAKLLEYIEPKIQNIEENRIETSALSDVSNTLESIILESKDNHFNIINFSDQEFIIRTIKVGCDNSDIVVEKYKTSKYLLGNINDNIKELPQYQEAVNYIEYLYEYLCNMNSDIKVELITKTNNLEQQELFNKYFIILSKKDAFVENVDEFIKFLNCLDLKELDRLNILNFVINMNIRKYTIRDDIQLENNIYLSNIKLLLDKNNHLVNKEIDGNPDLEINLDEFLINNNFNLEKLFERKISLIKKINEMYLEKDYFHLIPYYNEFNKILKYEKEFEKQQNGKKN